MSPEKNSSAKKCLRRQNFQLKNQNVSGDFLVTFTLDNMPFTYNMSPETYNVSGDIVGLTVLFCLHIVIFMSPKSHI